DFIFQNRLIDLGFIGDQFTWTNCKVNGNRIRERLDRALCTSKWRTDFDEALVYHESGIGLDHRPLSIAFHRNDKRRRVPFWFDALWLSKAECGLIIRDNWLIDSSSAANLNRGVGKLKSWSKTAHDSSIQAEAAIKQRLEFLASSNQSRQNINEGKALTIQINKFWNDENTA
ncbi:hypothetical protein LINGRAHAP2_LOCUS30541, partial [Linum grandiflorum]